MLHIYNITYIPLLSAFPCSILQENLLTYYELFLSTAVVKNHISQIV